MKKNHTWKTTTNKTVTVTIELITERVIGHDDFIGVLTKKCCEKRISVTVEGMGEIDGYSFSDRVQTINGLKYVATWGALGISSENMAAINAITAEIETSPEWIAKKDRENKSRAAEAEYQNSTAAINRAMCD